MESPTMQHTRFRSAFAAGAVAPEDLLAFHARTFGDARMQLDDGEQGGQDDDDGGVGADDDGAAGDEDGEAGEGDLGFPANTPVAEMTDAQRAAYHQHTSKKWEQRAKAKNRVDRRDYEAVIAERDQLRHAAETDHEREVREAREQGATEAREAEAREMTAAMFRMSLRHHGITDQGEIDTILSRTNLDGFRDAEGALDDQAVAEHAQRIAGTAGGKWPDMGQRRRQEKPSYQGLNAGADAYEQLHGKNRNPNS